MNREPVKQDSGQAAYERHDGPLSLVSGPAPPPVLDHELIRRIGRGSYGEVWLARNVMGAYRAIKFVYRGSFNDERPFKRELAGIENFEPISRSHEGFIDILQVGKNDPAGCFYYVMELGDDEQRGQDIVPETYTPKTLASEIRRGGRLAPQDCLEVGLMLSLALAELHKHRLVHRDIKPSNIIFINGVPKLADIGLVTRVEETCSIVGTEGFMPPEGPGTPSADVFSLGKVLYEALTGKDRLDYPELPSAIGTSDEDAKLLELNEIITQACHPDPTRRYRTAWEMHAEFVVLANGRSVKRLHNLERRFAYLKRVGSLTALALLVAGVFGHSLYLEWRTAEETKQRRIGAILVEGNHAMEAGDFTGALPFFAEAVQSDKSGSDEQWRHRFTFSSLHALSPKLTHLWVLPKELQMVTFAPDGRSLLLTEWSGKCGVYDLKSGEPLTPPGGLGKWVQAVAFSPDGRRIASAGWDKMLCVWSVPQGTELLRVPHPGLLWSVTFSPDGQQLLTGCVDGKARIFDSHSGQLLMTLAGHTDAVRCVTYNPQGNLICTASHDFTARLWDAHTGRPIGPPFAASDIVSCCRFSPDGRVLATGGFDHKARFYDVETRAEIFPEIQFNDAPHSIDFSPDGKIVAVACLDHSLRLFDPKSHQPTAQNPVLWHSDRVTHAVFSPNSELLASCCYDGTVRVWDLAGTLVAKPPEVRDWTWDLDHFFQITNNQLLTCDSGTLTPVASVSVPGNSKVVGRSYHGRFAATTVAGPVPTNTVVPLDIWDILAAKRAGHLLVTNPPSRMRILAHGSLVAILHQDSVETWLVSPPTFLSIWPMTNDWPRSACFAQGLLAAWNKKQVDVFNPTNGIRPYPPLRLPADVANVQLSPDETKLALCASDGSYRKYYCQLFELSTGRPVGPPLRHQDGTLVSTFSRDGQYLLTGGEDYTANLWQLAHPEHPFLSFHHHEQIHAVAIDDSNKIVALGSSDGILRLWSAVTGDPLTPPLRHLDLMFCIRIMKDQRHLVSQAKYYDCWRWDLPTDQRPPADLLALSRLLSGDHFEPAGRLPSEPYTNLWNRLQKSYPADFQVSDEQRLTWHEFQADESETNRDWAGASFHLKYLEQLEPGNDAIRRRYDHAQQSLAAASSAH